MKIFAKSKGGKKSSHKQDNYLTSVIGPDGHGRERRESRSGGRSGSRGRSRSGSRTRSRSRSGRVDRQDSFDSTTDRVSREHSRGRGHGQGHSHRGPRKYNEYDAVMNQLGVSYYEDDTVISAESVTLGSIDDVAHRKSVSPRMAHYNLQHDQGVRAFEEESYPSISQAGTSLSESIVPVASSLRKSAKDMVKKSEKETINLLHVAAESCSEESSVGSRAHSATTDIYEVPRDGQMDDTSLASTTLPDRHFAAGFNSASEKITELETELDGLRSAVKNLNLQTRKSFSSNHSKGEPSQASSKSKKSKHKSFPKLSSKSSKSQQHILDHSNSIGQSHERGSAASFALDDIHPSSSRASIRKTNSKMSNRSGSRQHDQHKDHDRRPTPKKDRERSRSASRRRGHTEAHSSPKSSHLSHNRRVGELVVPGDLGRNARRSRRRSRNDTSEC